MSTTPRERPILFSGPMVRAIMEGRKTATRRVVKPQPPADAEAVGANSYEGPEGPAWFWWKGNRDERKFWPPTTGGANSIHCPFGQPGDRLWVRETWAISGHYKDGPRYEYRAWPADGEAERSVGGRWKASIHMPRSASRITLEITRVRVERVQDITEADAIEEGVGPGYVPNASGSTSCVGHRPMFARLWNEINAPRGHGWASNPWLWVIDFERINMNASEP